MGGGGMPSGDVAAGGGRARAVLRERRRRGGGRDAGGRPRASAGEENAEAIIRRGSGGRGGAVGERSGRSSATPPRTRGAHGVPRNNRPSSISRVPVIHLRALHAPTHDVPRKRSLDDRGTHTPPRGRDDDDGYARGEPSRVARPRVPRDGGDEGGARARARGRSRAPHGGWPTVRGRASSRPRRRQGEPRRVRARRDHARIHRRRRHGRAGACTIKTTSPDPSPARWRVPSLSLACERRSRLFARHPCPKPSAHRPPQPPLRLSALASSATTPSVTA